MLMLLPTLFETIPQSVRSTVRLSGSQILLYSVRLTDGQTDRRRPVNRMTSRSIGQILAKLRLCMYEEGLR